VRKAVELSNEENFSRNLSGPDGESYFDENYLIPYDK